MSVVAPKAALVIATYNWPEALARALESALLQSQRAFEIIVADDGSRPDTAAAIERVLRPGDIPWRHVRQNDTGFRLSRARNLGVRHSRAPHLIFVDHDVLLHPEFIADHLRLARPGVVLLGKRCFLPPSRSARLLEGGLVGNWWPSPWTRGLGNRKNAIRWAIPGLWLARPRDFETRLRGSNLSVSREDFLRVDGFDETYDGSWGREDSDFCYRLFHAGVKACSLSFLALQAHLHHPQPSRRGLTRNDDELRRALTERRVLSRRGYSRMDAEGGVVASSDAPAES